MHFLHFIPGAVFVFTFFLQYRQDLFCPARKVIRHTGHFSHLYTKAMAAAARCQLSQEDHFMGRLFMGDMIVLYPVELMLELIELMVVGRKYGLGAGLVFLNIFYDRPGNGNTIVGTGTSADLIQQDQAAGGYVVHNAGGLVHLHHKGRFSAAQVI